ncbi:5'-methylthioadenosine/adenosylhomocysteine nucleosidase [Romboutsia sp.]|uniref:5'-methylthioadenosine/adenosylhomocysteine nucleosidase n=1 Tax=Romboutsia sp. TaxID=1965302 RepID=UPI003F2ACAF3
MNRIGIIGAMDEEVDILVELMDIKEKIEKASLKFYKGTIEGKDVVLVKCGIGKVNAALCTQILVSEFEVDAIVNTGVAGALHGDLGVYDIVISTDAIQHDFDTTAFGDKKGVIPRMESSVFVADDSLIKAAYESSSENTKTHKVVKGRVVSGDIFISSKELKDELVKEFDAYCGEMEGAAIAHVCSLNKVPFVIIRAMSDKADGSAEITYDEFVKDAAHNSKDIVLNMLKTI